MLSRVSKQIRNNYFHRFLLIMLPCDDLYLRSMATQKPTYAVLGRLNTNIERELVGLFEK